MNAFRKQKKDAQSKGQTPKTNGGYAWETYHLPRNEMRLKSFKMNLEKVAMFYRKAFAVPSMLCRHLPLTLTTVHGGK